MRPEDLIHFCPPGRLIIGCGTRSTLPPLVQRLGHRCGVFVTDAFFTRHTPWVQQYLDAAAALGIRTVVFDGGLPDPTTTLCDAATAALREQLAGTAPDHVIALGGGSNIDLAKALCLTLTEGRPVREFVGDIGGCRPLSLIALPTTSGTGSEATPGAILLDPGNATKVAVMDNALRPQVALIDPELSFTCPPRVTADAGIDAFTHAIESLLTIDSAAYDRTGHVDPGYSGRSSLTMMFAREAIRLCIAYLERAYRDGCDTTARIGMAYASVYAALSYGSAGLNAVHGIAYAVAGRTHCSHGSSNAVMLPYVLDALRDVRRVELLEVARLFGLPGDDAAALAALPQAVRGLVGRLGIPTDLRGFGIETSELDALVADALAVTRLAKAFPVVDVAGCYRAIVHDAFDGRLAADDRLELVAFN
ncbi:iron-containing alcohol dehydrogenase [Aquincola sp. S2]|uniref:Iron-containing alcohol dehydrogenase n=1 Tax=Pseudaquabacterium terrae TaxID=2732868 RepID=A0ABX2EUI5_9BURK|nr:iron-containing alcohol dehydrogenase [Aquabacterium terrae]NRF72380.1 iron-containing alcohol dehydrogenase [Aquabacterium terrae]